MSRNPSLHFYTCLSTLLGLVVLAKGLTRNNNNTKSISIEYNGISDGMKKNNMRLQHKG